MNVSCITEYFRVLCFHNIFSVQGNFSHWSKDRNISLFQCFVITNLAVGNIISGLKNENSSFVSWYHMYGRGSIVGIGRRVLSCMFELCLPQIMVWPHKHGLILTNSIIYCIDNNLLNPVATWLSTTLGSSEKLQ